MYMKCRKNRSKTDLQFYLNAAGSKKECQEHHCHSILYTFARELKEVEGMCVDPSGPTDLVSIKHRCTYRDIHSDRHAKKFMLGNRNSFESQEQMLKTWCEEG